MSIRDWRSKAAYEDVEHVPLRGLAWEYLRRNKDYVRTYHDLMRVPDAEPADVSVRRWGLRFCGRSGSVGGDSAPVLAADRDAGYRRIDRPDDQPVRSAAGPARSV